MIELRNASTWCGLTPEQIVMLPAGAEEMLRERIIEKDDWVIGDRK